MKKEQFCEAMTAIDDRYLTEAAETAQKKTVGGRRKWTVVPIAAALLAAAALQDRDRFPALIFNGVDQSVAGDRQKFVLKPVFTEKIVVAEVGAFLNTAKRAAADTLADHNNCFSLGEKS